MQIWVNGTEHEVAASATIAMLMAQLGLNGQRIAVEVNREIVPRSTHQEHRLHDRDRVEIVGAVGGG